MGRNQYSLPVFFLNGIFFVDMYACYRFYHCTFTTTSLTPALVISSRRRRWRERIKVYGLYFFHPHSLFIPQQNTGPSTKYTENHSRDEPHRSSETLSLNVDYIYSFFSLSSFLYPSRYRWVFFPLLFTEYYYSGETQLGLTWKPLVSRILGGCRDRSLATSDRQLWRDLPFAMVFFSRPLVHETTLLFSSSFWMNASMEYKHNQARKKLISLLRSTISAFVWGEFVAVACLLLLLLLLLCFITRMKMVMMMMTTCLYSIADVTAKVDTLCGPKGKRRAIEMEKRNIYIINSFFRPFQFAEQSSLIIHLFSCDQGSLSVRLAVCKRSSVCMKSFVEHYSNC